MDRKDGDIDYSGCSLSELRDVEAHIDAQSYPKNYANLLDALERASKDEKNKPKLPLSIRQDARDSYKITAKGHATHILPVLIYVIGIPVLGIFSYGLEGFGVILSSAAKYGLAIILVFIVLPQAALHWSYWKTNTGMDIRIEPDHQIIQISRRDKQLRFSVTDINRIRIVRSIAASSSWFTAYPWQDYAFAEVSMQDGRRAVITSLLVPIDNWDAILEGFELDQELYPWPTTQKF